MWRMSGASKRWCPSGQLNTWPGWLGEKSGHLGATGVKILFRAMEIVRVRVMYHEGKQSMWGQVAQRLRNLGKEIWGHSYCKYYFQWKIRDLSSEREPCRNDTGGICRKDSKIKLGKIKRLCQESVVRLAEQKAHLRCVFMKWDQSTRFGDFLQQCSAAWVQVSSRKIWISLGQGLIRVQ